MKHSAVVTGASGFLGRHVARLFARKGHTVLGIGHGDWIEDEWKSWGLSEWRRADVTLEALQASGWAPGTVVHCAGSGSVAFANEHPLEDFERVVSTTAQVLAYVRSFQDCRFVYPSSTGVYGNVDTIPIREDGPAVPISLYGMHKLMAEQMVEFSARQFGIPSAIVRLFSIYGCGQRKQLLWDACRKLSAGDNVFMGTGEEVRDWIHVEDAAELMMLAAGHASSQSPIVNGGSGDGVTVREVVEQLSRSLLSKEPAVRFSGAPRAGDPARFVADIQRATSWGWRPVHDWKTGMAEYVAWWSRGAE